jgi:metallophosphoesterase superfamily enzyme
MNRRSNIIYNFILKDKYVFFTEEDLLVIGDLHLGKHIRMNRYEPPKINDNKVQKEVIKAIRETEPETLVLNGDVFHYVNAAPSAIRLIKDICSDTCVSSVELLLGNHERDGEILKEKFIDCSKISVSMEYEQNGIVVTHGHKKPEKSGDLFVISHLHPAVTVNGSVQRCYLKTDVRDDVPVFVLPAFHPDIVGSDISKEPIQKIVPLLEDTQSSDILYAMKAFCIEDFKEYTWE